MALTRGVFTLQDAKRAGLKRWHLEGSSWRRLGSGAYAWNGLADTPDLRLEAARLRVPSEGIFSGLTAAWLHGLDVNPCSPIEVTVPKGRGVSGRAGLSIRRARIARDEVVRIRGQWATSIVRTLRDIGARLTLTEAVVVADMALHKRLVTIHDLTLSLARYASQPGIAQLRRMVAEAEPAAESPMETRVRMLLVLAGLPRPDAQVEIYDSSGAFAGRPDLYYANRRLGIEYDGAIHRENLAEDNRRQNRLLDAGVTLLRFTAADLNTSPRSIVSLVRRALSPVLATAGS